MAKTKNMIGKRFGLLTVIEEDGRAKKCIAAWAEERGVAAKTLQTRIQQLHWPVESALTRKVGI